MRLSRRLMAGAALAFIITGSASMAGATPTGSIGYIASGGASADTSDLATATSVSVVAPFVTAGPGQGDLSGIPSGTSMTISPTSFAVTPVGAPEASTLSLDIDGNLFVFTEQEVTVNSTTGSGASQSSTLAFAFTGSVTGPDITGGTDTASATISFNQTGGSGATIGFSGTAAHPSQVHIPEPAGLAVVGLGLLSLGFMRRRSV